MENDPSFELYTCHFGKVGKLVSEEVIFQLVKRKCMPIFLCGLIVVWYLQPTLDHLIFVCQVFLFKLFRSTNTDDIDERSVLKKIVL